MRNFIAIAVLSLLATLASAKNKDHSTEYKVGVLQSTEVVNTGTYTSCDGGCMSQSTGHNIHYVVTDEGAYGIDSPTNTGLSILQGMGNPKLPSVHIQWFMDDLHEGDKVLFAVECDKHNNCRFWLPKPDQQGKEYHTIGWFRPRVAKTNTNQLCGTGKLSAEVEAQVCAPQQTPAPVTEQPTAPATQSPEEAAKRAQQYADCLKVAVNNPSIVCKP